MEIELELWDKIYVLSCKKQHEFHQYMFSQGETIVDLKYYRRPLLDKLVNSFWHVFLLPFLFCEIDDLDITIMDQKHNLITGNNIFYP